MIQNEQNQKVQKERTFRNCTKWVENCFGFSQLSENIRIPRETDVPNDDVERNSQ